MSQFADKRMLVALAHPDDESFGMGGTLAYYAAQGVDVHLVCATRGEAGSVDPEFMEGYASVAELREAELRCAAEQLGLSGLEFLDYRDSGMAGSKDNEHKQAFIQAPIDQVVETLVGHIRRVKPQVVVTFDSTGGYHHPDHIHIHKAATLAFHAAGDAEAFAQMGALWQPEKLYYMALNRRRVRWLVRTMPLMGKDPRKLGRNKDIDLTVLARDADTPRHVSINYKSVQERKEAADNCHASQLSGGWPRNPITELYYRLFGRSNHYTRAFPETPDDYRADDLFAD